MHNQKTTKVLKIGELAKAAGVSTDTLRYYESQDLLSPLSRTSAGYRLYGMDAVDRVYFIKRSKLVGFSLKEIKGLLLLRESPENSCKEIHNLASRRLELIMEDIAALKSMKNELETVINSCPSSYEPKEQCEMLESFDRHIAGKMEHEKYLISFLDEKKH